MKVGCGKSSSQLKGHLTATNGLVERDLSSLVFGDADGVGEGDGFLLEGFEVDHPADDAGLFVELAVADIGGDLDVGREGDGHLVFEADGEGLVAGVLDGEGDGGGEVDFFGYETVDIGCAATEGALNFDVVVFADGKAERVARAGDDDVGFGDVVAVHVDIARGVVAEAEFFPIGEEGGVVDFLFVLWGGVAGEDGGGGVEVEEYGLRGVAPSDGLRGGEGVFASEGVLGHHGGVD